MTNLICKNTICIVTVFDEGKYWLFGAYEDENTARERIKELDFLIGSDTKITYHNEIVWGNKGGSE